MSFKVKDRVKIKGTAHEGDVSWVDYDGERVEVKVEGGQWFTLPYELVEAVVVPPKVGAVIPQEQCLDLPRGSLIRGAISRERFFRHKDGWQSEKGIRGARFEGTGGLYEILYLPSV